MGVLGAASKIRKGLKKCLNLIERKVKKPEERNSIAGRKNSLSPLRMAAANQQALALTYRVVSVMVKESTSGALASAIAIAFIGNFDTESARPIFYIKIE